VEIGGAVAVVTGASSGIGRAVAVDLAERGATVVVTTSSGRRHPGRVAGVGADFVAVRADGDRTTLVALTALASVRVNGLGPAMRSGTQPAMRSVAVSMADVLAHAAARRPRVHVHCDAATVAGELRSVGTDVVTLRTDGDPSSQAYVSLASVSEISLLDSG
jgi:NAD(P)-dependent dehydrogenase (short-subunit alcohol dehydrogenase family)